MPLAPAAPDKTAEAGIYGFSLSSSSHQPRTGRGDHSAKSCMIGKQIKVSRLMQGDGRRRDWKTGVCVCVGVDEGGGGKRGRNRTSINPHVTSFASFDTLTLPLTHNGVFCSWQGYDEITARTAAFRFWNKIGFIPPNMCSVRLRRNLTMFNKSLFVACWLTQKSGACLLCL